MSYLIKESLLQHSIVILLGRSNSAPPLSTGDIAFRVCNYVIPEVAREVDEVKNPRWSRKVLGTSRFRSILKRMEKKGIVKRVKGGLKSELYWRLV